MRSFLPFIQTRHPDTLYGSFDLDPVTLMYKLDLDILKTCLLAVMKFLAVGFQH